MWRSRAPAWVEACPWWWGSYSIMGALPCFRPWGPHHQLPPVLLPASLTGEAGRKGTWAAHGVKAGLAMPGVRCPLSLSFHKMGDPEGQMPQHCAHRHSVPIGSLPCLIIPANLPGNPMPKPHSCLQAWFCLTPLFPCPGQFSPETFQDVRSKHGPGLHLKQARWAECPLLPSCAGSAPASLRDQSIFEPQFPHL